MRRRLVCTTFAALLTGCGGTSGPPPAVSLALAPTYEAVAVMRVLPDGLAVSRLDAFEMRLFGLQSSGGRVVGSVERGDRGPSYELDGTFDAQDGRFRFEPFDGTFTSSRSERIDALGGRGDDDFPVDGLANTITGFVQTSSGARYQTDGTFVGVAVAEGLPRLEVGKVTAVETELGKVILQAEAGFAEGSVGIEVFVFSPFTEQPEFRLIEALDDGAVRPTALEGLGGDVLVLRALRAGRLGPAIFVRVEDG